MLLMSEKYLIAFDLPLNNQSIIINHQLRAVTYLQINVA